MTRGSSLADRRRERGDIPAEVIEAARRNFLHFGVNRTTMADIARAVGIPRQTLYEYVSSRDQLVDAVLVARIKEIAEEIAGAVPPAAADRAGFAEALVETSLGAIRKARDDHELMNIVATGPNERVQQVVTGPYPEVHEIVRRLLAPILDRGAESGELRTDKSRDEIIGWVRIVYLSLISQTSIDPDTERELVAGFLLPSLMFGPGAARS